MDGLNVTVHGAFSHLVPFDVHCSLEVECPSKWNQESCSCNNLLPRSSFNETKHDEKFYTLHNSSPQGRSNMIWASHVSYAGVRTPQLLHSTISKNKKRASEFDYQPSRHSNWRQSEALSILFHHLSPTHHAYYSGRVGINFPERFASWRTCRCNYYAQQDMAASAQNRNNTYMLLVV